jgi:hypothetical protein
MWFSTAGYRSPWRHNHHCFPWPQPHPSHPTATEPISPTEPYRRDQGTPTLGLMWFSTAGYRTYYRSPCRKVGGWLEANRQTRASPPFHPFTVPLREPQVLQKITHSYNKLPPPTTNNNKCSSDRANTHHWQFSFLGLGSGFWQAAFS